MSGAALPGPRSRAAARKRRAAAIGAALLIAISGIGAVALTGEAGNAPRIDGRFDEWPGRTFALEAENGAGAVAAGFQPIKGDAGMYLEFDRAPFEGRADVWVFLDGDGDGATGFWDGSLGAESAVRISGEGGRLLAATAYAFAGRDRFDLMQLASRGRVPAAAVGPRLEIQLPDVPGVFSVAVATGKDAAASGAFTSEGTPVTASLQGEPLSLALRNGIRIDGDFADWQGVLHVADPEDRALPSRLDILSIAAVGDGASAQFKVDVRGGALEGTLPLRADPIGTAGGASATPSPPPTRTAGTDRLDVYLDTDLSALTGAAFAGVGAENLLHIEGIDGVVVLAEFYDLDGAIWKLSQARAEAAAGGGSIEAAVDAAGLVGARARFSLSGFEGAMDLNDTPVEVARHAGALGAPLGGGNSLPEARSGVEFTPIPEFSEVAVGVGGAALIALGARRGRRPNYTVR